MGRLPCTHCFCFLDLSEVLWAAAMQVQLETEAAEEAELMEKHTCWCKERGCVHSWAFMKLSCVK